MDVSRFKIHGARAIVALIALTVGASFMQASGNLLTETPGGGSAGGGVTLTCSTTAGPGSAVNIVLKPAGAIGSSTYVVTYTAMTGFTITPPNTTSLTSANASSGLTYSIQANAGCAGVSGTLQFLVGGTDDVTVAITDNVTATATALVATPSITVACTLNAGTYTPGVAQTVSVTSAATGGTPFTTDTTVANDPAWLTLNPVSPAGTATATPTTFTVAATPTGGSPGCGGFAVSTTHTVNLHLKSGVSGTTPDKLVQVTLQVVPPSPLTVTPVPTAPGISMSYVKSSGNMGTANVSVTSLVTVPNAYFLVNVATFPAWLTVDSTSGITTKSLRFSTTNVADSLPPGTYSATIYLQVSGYADLPVPITLLVTNKPATLSFNPAAVVINWSLGSSSPTATIVASSSDTPIPYSIVTGGPLAPIVPASEKTGLAYSFGTTINLSFNPLLFSSSTPGTVITGTVTFTWGSPAAVTVVPVTLTVVSPGATLTGISPATLPTAAPGTQFTVTLTGSGFVGGSDPTLKTRVGTVAGSPAVLSVDTNFSVNVINSSNLILTIVVPNTADPLLPFSPTGAGGPVYLGVVNGTSTIPTGTKTLNIGNGPIVQGVTSASAFTEVTSPTLPTLAAYDMISIFGSNFCSSTGTGCGTTTILPGSPDALTMRYPTTVTPDAVSATQRFLSVNMMPHGQSSPVWPAPILFATNGQINAIVPAAVNAYVGANAVDIVVNFGYGTTTNLLKSPAFPVNIAASDPGMFTVGSDGQGSVAALNTSWSLITGTNPAGMRTGTVAGADSDTIQLYVTGLGVPNSVGDNTSVGDGTAALSNCIAAVPGAGNLPGSYMATLQNATSVTPALTNIDGAVIQSALLNTHRFAPCLTTVPTVTIGGEPGTVTFAGFVADTVAGLYQINVQLPSTYTLNAPFYPNFPATTSPITTLKQATQLPVFVTVGSQTSQSGASIWVAPRLLMTEPAGVGSLQVGHHWSGTVSAQEGTGNISFAVTSGVLPSGLTLTPSSGVIAGIPGPNTNGSYAITVTATDSASIPVTGSIAFTIVVAGGLYVTSTGVSPYNAVYGTASNSLTSITALGGVFPYSYQITTPATAPAGMAITTGTVGQNSVGVLSTTTATPAGIYNITVTATDAVGTTGTLAFQVVVALNLTFNPTTAVTVAASSATTITTVTAAGGSGSSYTYSLDPTLNSPNALLLTLDPNAGTLSAGTAADTAISGMTVYIDAVDDNPANTGATTVAPGQASITVIIQN